ncbi:MAG: hypothetical protein KF690_03630 [Bacteroidetes bacterium]|nr:hypothetical protein [Bacteroidota bacterium]
MAATPPADFAAFLSQKKIDGQAFAARASQEYSRAAREYAVLGPVAFDQRKKFYLNDWRLRFPAPALS